MAIAPRETGAIPRAEYVEYGTRVANLDVMSANRTVISSRRSVLSRRTLLCVCAASLAIGSRELRASPSWQQDVGVTPDSLPTTSRKTRRAKRVARTKRRTSRSNISRGDIASKAAVRRVVEFFGRIGGRVMVFESRSRCRDAP